MHHELILRLRGNSGGQLRQIERVCILTNTAAVNTLLLFKTCHSRSNRCSGEHFAASQDVPHKVLLRIVWIFEPDELQWMVSLERWLRTSCRRLGRCAHSHVFIACLDLFDHVTMRRRDDVTMWRLRCLGLGSILHSLWYCVFSQHVSH